MAWNVVCFGFAYFFCTKIDTHMKKWHFCAWNILIVSITATQLYLMIFTSVALSVMPFPHLGFTSYTAQHIHNQISSKNDSLGVFYSYSSASQYIKHRLHVHIRLMLAEFRCSLILPYFFLHTNTFTSTSVSTLFICIILVITSCLLQHIIYVKAYSSS